MPQQSRSTPNSQALAGPSTCALAQLLSRELTPWAGQVPGRGQALCTPVLYLPAQWVNDHSPISMMQSMLWYSDRTSHWSQAHWSKWRHTCLDFWNVQHLIQSDAHLQTPWLRQSLGVDQIPATIHLRPGPPQSRIEPAQGPA